MIRIVVTGAKGRMGRTVLTCAGRQSDLEVVGEIDLEDELASVIHQADVVVDFSLHPATQALAALCAQERKALVIGSTGHSPAERAAVVHHHTTIPIVWASNFSLGVNTLFWLTRKAAQILGTEFDLEIVEMHHRLKKDAPSGTAATLAAILAEERQTELAKAVRHGREGIVGERSSTEIGVHSLRGGDVVGEHTVVFAGPGERLELTQRAASRETFAQGALRAARWVVQQPPGLYDMRDVLGLNR